MMTTKHTLTEDTVSHLQSQSPIVFTPETLVRDAVVQMQLERQGCVLVCEKRVLIGIFTERDLLEKILAAQQSVDIPLSRVMTSTPSILCPDDKVSVAVKTFRQGGYRHIPVVNEQGEPISVLSVKQIVHFLVEHYPEAVYNLPPDPDDTVDDPEGA